MQEDVYVRRNQAIKRHEEKNEPEYGVDSLDWKLGCGKQQWEKRHMACHSQWSKCSEVTTVPERNQAERDDHDQDRLLMDVPAEKERRISTEGHSTDEVLPGGLEEQADQERLREISQSQQIQGTSRILTT